MGGPLSFWCYRVYTIFYCSCQKCISVILLVKDGNDWNNWKDNDYSETKLEYLEISIHFVTFVASLLWYFEMLETFLDQYILKLCLKTWKAAFQTSLCHSKFTICKLRPDWHPMQSKFIFVIVLWLYFACAYLIHFMGLTFGNCTIQLVLAW